MELMNKASDTLSAEEKARELHNDIIYNYRAAAHHLVEAAKCLKEMRDTKAYLSLGMESFEDYTEKMAGIKARQAYTYIATLERLGQPMMEEHSSIGITKLSLLAEITPVDREAFAAENDLAGMTVKEIEALIAENTRRGEQISLFEEKVAAVVAEREELQREIEELKTQPTEPVSVVATVEPDPAVLKKREREIKENLQKDFDKKLEKAKASVQEELAAAKKVAEQALKEKADIEERVRREMAAQHSDEMRRMQESATVSSDGDYRAVDIYFAQLQETANNLLKQIEQIRAVDAEKAIRTEAALATYFERLAVKCKGGDPGCSG